MPFVIANSNYDNLKEKELNRFFYEAFNRFIKEETAHILF